ncbi:MAG TPA: response regulator transcription factor, partial [Myxococcaceae bacterium]|nr:response regulator transcription factor [Myxococcaceae bacterium]
MASPHSRSGPGGLRLVVIAEDPLARDVFRDRLLEDPWVEVVAAVSGPQELVASRARESVDAAIWDLGVRPELALPLVPDVVAEIPSVIALAVDRQVAAEALAAGVRAVVARDRSGRAIAAAVRALLEGLEVIDPSVEPPDSVLRPSRASADELTPRERQVLALLVEGLSNAAIGQRLGISDHTAKFHVTA